MIAPPPFQTPFLDMGGRITTVWIAWLASITKLSSGGATITEGTHAARLTTAGQSVGSLWYETDRHVTYVLTASGWQFAGGVQSGAFTSRPTDLGASDAGYAFVATDTGVLYSWSGSAWVQLTITGPAVWGPAAPGQPIWTWG